MDDQISSITEQLAVKQEEIKNLYAQLTLSMQPLRSAALL